MNQDEETRGFVAAMKAIEKDGDILEAAKHHSGVASGDLQPDAFTRGWKRACDKFILANSKKEKEDAAIANGWRREFIEGNGVDAELWLSPDNLCYYNLPEEAYISVTPTTQTQQ